MSAASDAGVREENNKMREISKMSRTSEQEVPWIIRKEVRHV